MIKSKKRAATLTIAAIFALSTIGAALADEHDGDEPAEDVVTTVWDDETAILVVSIDDSDAEEGACDTVVVTRDDEGNLVVTVDGTELGEDGELPEGCMVFDGTGPNGQVNHGTVVSSVAKSVSPHDLDGMKKGELMREIAKIGKDEITKVKPGDGDDDEPSTAEAKDSRLDKGNKGNGKGHSK